MVKHTQRAREEQVRQSQSKHLADQVYQYLRPLLGDLNAKLDRRLVSTFLKTVMAIMRHRHRQQGLLLSELGSFLLAPEQARAGTKRLSNLIHSAGWSGNDIDDFLWQQADQRVTMLAAQGEPALVVWDASVLEKPESLQLEGLCAVRSSKAQRLKRIKPGYFNPPGGRPICVPGMHWLQVLVMGRQGVPTLAHTHWWTTRGNRASQRRPEEREILRLTADRWGSQVLHIWDRGFAGNPWLTLAFVHTVRFVLRWPKHYKLIDDQGRLRKAWEINRGQRSWEHRRLWDARRRCYRKTGVVAYPVQDPTHRQPLWLVVSRPGQGRTPWYLLTSEPIHSAEAAWRIVLAYARRWQVEMALRFTKSELAFESPRVFRWDNRRKLLLIAALAYGFLLSLLRPAGQPLVAWLLRTWCHRTGTRSRKTPTPLYRLRFAISRFWLTHPPPFLAK